MDGFCKIFPEINFSGFFYSMSFPVISHALGNWQENPCISHMMKYAKGWQSNGKNHLLYGKSMGTNFSGIPHSMDFIMLWEIGWESPYICHVMKYTIGSESNGKSTHAMGKSMSINFSGFQYTMGFLGYYREPIFHTFSIRWVRLSFPMLWEINEKTHSFPMW